MTRTEFIDVLKIVLDIVELDIDKAKRLAEKENKLAVENFYQDELSAFGRIKERVINRANEFGGAA